MRIMQHYMREDVYKRQIQTLRKSATFTFQYKNEDGRGMCDMLTEKNKKEIKESFPARNAGAGGTRGHGGRLVLRLRAQYHGILLRSGHEPLCCLLYTSRCV